MRLPAVLLVLTLLVPLAAKDKKVFTMPKAYHAKSYPAHNANDLAKVAVAADPYDMPDKMATAFTQPYRDYELLPVLLVVTNDGDAPINLMSMKVELVTVEKVKIAPAQPGDIYRRLSRLKRRPDKPRVQVPIPLPRGDTRSVKPEAIEEVENSQFLAKAVEPHETRAGFLFFDVMGISQPLAGARLYIEGIANDQGEEIIYFEIPMEKYLTYKPSSH